MNRWVEISFDCLPLRSVQRLDVPLDASPDYRQLCQRINDALQRHGTHNAYYLHQARCTYHLVNDPNQGVVQFRFEGTVLTDTSDQHTQACDLTVELAAETCSWLTEPVVEWFRQCVPHAVRVEFDHYIQAGDLEKAKERIARIEASSDEAGGFLGMYL